MSVSFQGFKPEYFARSAKIIGESSEKIGSKISWLSTEPAVDMPGKFQGIARTVKSLSKDWIANGLVASEAALSWSKALVEVVSWDSEEDKGYFEAAKKAFNSQGALYINEFNISGNPNDKIAANNYFNAADVLNNFLNEDRFKGYERK